MIRYAAVVGALLVGGCAGQNTAYQQRLEVLQDKVLILQNERDRFEERLVALEARIDAESTGGVETRVAEGGLEPAVDGAPANLEVVRLVPRPALVAQAPEEPAVSIVGQGADVGIVAGPEPVGTTP